VGGNFRSSWWAHSEVARYLLTDVARYSLTVVGLVAAVGLCVVTATATPTHNPSMARKPALRQVVLMIVMLVAAIGLWFRVAIIFNGRSMIVRV
jgi:FtsH-binding integral membrane protein